MLLDAAEVLFASQGFAATSMREIAARAGVNLAAAHYHFGGKRGLMEAVLKRRVIPLNQERLEQLDSLEAESRRRKVSLDSLLEAFLGPALRMVDRIPGGGESFVRLMGRAFIEPDPAMRAFFMDLFKEVARRFIPAFQQALPGLPPHDFFWRLHFMIGSLAHTMGDRERLQMMSRGQVDPDDMDTATRQLVAFVSGGLRAPAVRTGKRRRR